MRRGVRDLTMEEKGMRRGRSTFLPITPRQAIEGIVVMVGVLSAR